MRREAEYGTTIIYDGWLGAAPANQNALGRYLRQTTGLQDWDMSVLAHRLHCHSI